jgi:CRISPR/Cas system-associated exonuclease Cas4 (RecB family)
MPRKRDDISYKEFLRHSVPVHLLEEYVYCPAKVPNYKLQGEVTTPIILEGRLLHEADAQKALAKIGRTRKIKVKKLSEAMAQTYLNIKVALSRKMILANSEEQALFLTILPEFGIFGKPDKVDCSDGTNPIIIETKITSRLPTSAWHDHEVQLGTYMMGLERLGFHTPHGCLDYIRRDSPEDHRQYLVTLTESLRKEVAHIAGRVANLLLEKEEPKATTNPRKCIACRFTESCSWKPQSLGLSEKPT